MKTDYDVIIIGAGPAGSSCAQCLVKNNISTLILERFPFKRFKACGGLLNRQSFNFLIHNFGPIPESMLCSPGNVSIRFSRLGNAFLENTNGSLLSVQRHAFDYWLLQESKADAHERAVFRDYRLKNPIIEVNFTLDGECKALTCKYLVGADGGWSKVRKQCGPAVPKNKYLVLRQGVYTGKCDLDPHYYYFLFSKQYSEFLSWFTRKNDLIYIGTSFLPGKPKKYYEHLLDKVKTDYSLKDLQLLRTESCFGDIRLTRERFFFGNNNVLLAGEAAGLLNGFGEGISSALISGKKAAKSIIQAQSTGENPYTIYSQNIEKEKQRALRELKIMG